MMYSPVVVAGSNTHNNMPQKKAKVVANHTFRGCRDVFVNPGPRSTPGQVPFVIVTDAGGNGSFSQVICPMGLTSCLLGASSYTAGVTGNVTCPPLRGLYNKAIDFQMYRITRAKLVFVSNVGSTTTGTITLFGFTDPYDAGFLATQVFVSGPNSRTFDLASGATKELSVPVPVDTSWKKVSSVLTVPGNMFPFTAATPGSLGVVASVSDLCVGAVTAYVQNGPVSAANAGSYFLDYDVEFKGVTDAAINA